MSRGTVRSALGHNAIVSRIIIHIILYNECTCARYCKKYAYNMCAACVLIALYYTTDATSAETNRRLNAT